MFDDIAEFIAARGMIEQMLSNGEWYAPEKMLNRIYEALGESREW